METIKFKKSDTILVGIIIALIFIFIVIAFNKHREKEKTEGKQKQGGEKNRLMLFVEKLQLLGEQISQQLKQLKLTQEVEAMLERKINRYLLVVKISCFAVFVFLIILFTTTGTDLITAILNTTGIIGTFFFGASAIIANKFEEPNAVIASFTIWVRNVVYKKYGYDPALIPTLKESIAHKQTEAKEIHCLINIIETSN